LNWKCSIVCLFSPWFSLFLSVQQLHGKATERSFSSIGRGNTSCSISKAESHADGNNSILQMPLVGTPSAKWCSKRSFPHKGDSGLLSNSRGSLRLVPYLCSSSNLQQQRNSSAFPTNCGGYQSPTGRKINKTKGKVKQDFCDFQV
jgi:hypothetical protein